MAKKLKTDTPQDETESAGTAKAGDLHKRAIARYKVLDDYWRDNLDRALTAIKFRAGEEWPEEIKAKRQKKNRPVLTFRRGEQYIRQVVNDGRQNRPGVKFLPAGGGSTVDIATGLQGLSRAIHAKSRADSAFDCALEHGAGSGFGYFRVCTDYEHEGGFEQEIQIKRVPNPLSVRLAPHQSADGSDAEDGFVIDEMSREAFKRQYPNAELTNWGKDDGRYEDGWLSPLNVRVAEYFYKVGTEETLLQLEDGTALPQKDYDKAIADGVTDMPPIKSRRLVRDIKVKWCRLSGAEVLEENEFPSKYIPIVPVYGTERNINGKVIYEGMIGVAMDPLRLYNFERTAYAERVALTPKAPFIAAEGQLDGHPEWETANEDNHPYLTYNQVDVNGERAPPPRREQAADIPSHYAQSIQITEGDIQASFGMYNATIGAPSNEKSGRAITARQREGDVSTFHYHDNLNRAVEHLGRIELDMFPRVFDTKRTVRLLSEDGTDEEVILDPDFPEAVGKIDGVRVLNITKGRYTVLASSGPSYTTQRQEAADAMLENARNNPEFWTTHGDLIVKSQDWPNAEEFAERTLAVMPPALRAAIAQAKQEDGEGEDSEAIQALMQQAQGEIQKREEALQQAGAEIERLQKAEADKSADRQLKDDENAVKRYEAETARLKEILPALTPEQAAFIVAQTLQQVQTPFDLDLDLDPGALVANQPAPPNMPPMPAEQPMPMGIPNDIPPDMPPPMPPDMGDQPIPLN